MIETSFSGARGLLRKKFPASFTVVSSRLNELSFEIGILNLLNECDLRKYLPESSDRLLILKSAVGILVAGLPIAWADTGEEESDGFWAYPELFGLDALASDDIDQTLSYMADYERKEASLYTFVVYYFTTSGDEYIEDYSKHAKYFGWPLKSFIPFGEGYCLKDIDSEDVREFLRLNDKKILLPIVDYIFNPPDSPYWTFNPENDDCCIELDAENIRSLRDGWAESEPILEGFEKAAKRVAKTPSLLIYLYSAVLYAQREAAKRRENR